MAYALLKPFKLRVNKAQLSVQLLTQGFSNLVVITTLFKLKLLFNKH